MKTKKITDQFETRGATKPAHANIPKEIHRLVSEQLAADRSTGIVVDWTRLIHAACLNYLRERGHKIVK